MTNLTERHGCEKTLEKDPQTGREIWRMTNHPSHNLHTYYDASSWSPDGSKIAFTAILPEDVIPEKLASTHKGALFVMDAAGDHIHCVAESVAFELHTGCLPIWKDKQTIIFRGKHPDGKHYTGIVDITTREIREVQGLLSRGLNPDRTKLICQWEESDQSEKQGVTIIDLDNLSCTEIITSDELTEAMLDTFNRAERMPDMDADRMIRPQVANIKWSPDGAKLMLRFNYMPGQYMKSLFVLNPDGTDLTRMDLVTPAFGHHSWHPDARHILYCDRSEIGPGPIYYLIDRDGLGRRALHTERLGGHPIFNPAGTEIVDFGNGWIWHLEVETGNVQKLASYTNNLHSGLHPHPSWSPDGTQVIYHSDHTGTTQLYVLQLH